MTPKSEEHTVRKENYRTRYLNEHGCKHFQQILATVVNRIYKGSITMSKWHLDLICKGGSTHRAINIIYISSLKEDWQDGSVGKVLATNLDNLSLNPRTHTVAGED